jgi:hypothetical protein
MAETPLKIPIVAFDKTRAAFSSVRGGLNKVKGSIFSVKGALTGLAAAAGVKKLASDIDSLAKQSSRLGVTVNQLQTLQFAASQTGTDANELAKGFEKFNKSISEASGGVGTGVKAFEALGITLTNNDGTLKDSDTLLGEVADGFTGIKAPADRVRIAMDLFGRSGAGMVNMLQDGSAQLAETRAEFNKLTIELTGPQAKSVEKANDLFDKLKRTFASIAQQITVAVLPVLASVAKVITQVVLVSFARLIENLGVLQVAFAKFFNKTFATLPMFSKMSEEAFGSEAAEKMRAIADAYNSVSGAVDKVGESGEGAADGIERVETSLEKSVAQLKTFSEASKDVKAKLADIAVKGVNTLTDSLVSVVNGTKSAKEAFKSMAASIINDLLKIMIQKSITGPLAGALGGLEFFKKTSTPTAAIGGPMQRGRTTLVGERGPELFIPSSSGSIVPNNQIGGGGGVTVNQTLNISTGVSQTVRAEIAQLMPQISNSAKAAVLDAKQRGGSFSKAF